MSQIRKNITTPGKHSAALASLDLHETSWMLHSTANSAVMNGTEHHESQAVDAPAMINVVHSEPIHHVCLELAATILQYVIFGPCEAPWGSQGARSKGQQQRSTSWGPGK